MRPDPHDPHRHVLFALTACQAGAIAATWPLWQARASPPLLPALGVPALEALDFGMLLLGTLSLIVVRPRLGLGMHVAALTVAVLADQTRLQPWAFSMPLLLAAAGPRPALRSLGRAHLATLWIWAGAHKLLSPAFAASAAPALLARAWPDAPALLAEHGGLALPLAELMVGLLAVAPATRRGAGFAGALLHGGVALFLIAARESPALVSWNVALALSALALFARLENEGPEPGAPRALLCMAAMVLALAPAGFYAGLTDAYLAHVLYTGDVDRTLRCDASGECVSDMEQRQSRHHLGVAFPPEPRLFREHFARTCRPGELMHVTGATTVLHPPELRIATMRCPGPVHLALTPNGS